MRTALVLVLICTCCFTYAQKKVTWQIVLELNGTSSRSEVRKSTTAFYYLLDTPNHIFRGSIIEGTSRNSTAIRPGFTGGFSVSYPAKKNLVVHAGLMANFYSFENVTNTTYRTVDTAMAQVPPDATYLPGPFLVRGTKTRSEAVVSVISVDIPVGIRINSNASRWILEVDFIPSFTLKSTRLITQNDREYSSKAPGAVRSITFGAGAGIAYRLTERFEIGARYRYVFTNVLEEPYPETKVQSLGLQLRYTLPSLFARRK